MASSPEAQEAIKQKVREVAAHAEDLSRRLAKRATELAVLAGDHSWRASRAAGSGARDAAVAASAAMRQGALAAAEGAWILAKRLAAIARQGLNDLQHSEAFRLRQPEEVQSFEAWFSAIRRIYALDSLLQEFKAMPGPVVFALGFLSLRAIAALGDLTETLMTELLYGRSFMSRAAALGASMPGCLAAWHFRTLFLQELQALPHEAAQCRSQVDVAILRFARLLRVARCLPPAFWLSVAMSGAMAMQVARDVSKQSVRMVLKSRLRTLLITSMAGAALTSPAGKAALGKAISSCTGRGRGLAQRRRHALEAWPSSRSALGGGGGGGGGGVAAAVNSAADAVFHAAGPVFHGLSNAEEQVHRQ